MCRVVYFMYMQTRGLRGRYIIWDPRAPRFAPLEHKSRAVTRANPAKTREFACGGTRLRTLTLRPELKKLFNHCPLHTLAQPQSRYAQVSNTINFWACPIKHLADAADE